MVDVNVINEPESWFYITRFTVVPQVGETIVMDVGEGKQKWAVERLWHESLNDGTNTWIPHVSVTLVVDG